MRSLLPKSLRPQRRLWHTLLLTDGATGHSPGDGRDAKAPLNRPQNSTPNRHRRPNSCLKVHNGRPIGLEPREGAIKPNTALTLARVIRSIHQLSYPIPVALPHTIGPNV